MPLQISFDKEQLEIFCHRHHIRKLSFFGSVLRDDFNQDSDIDILVDFDPSQTIGLRIFDIEAELSHILNGRKVDMIREKYLNHRLRPKILASAQVAYAA